MNLVVRKILPTILCGFLCHSIGYSQSAPPDFEIIDINTNLNDDAIGFAPLPDGRILIIHQFSGEVRLIVNGVLKSQPLLTVPNLAGLVEKDFWESPSILISHRNPTFICSILMMALQTAIAFLDLR